MNSQEEQEAMQMFQDFAALMTVEFQLVGHKQFRVVLEEYMAKKNKEIAELKREVTVLKAQLMEADVQVCRLLLEKVE